MSKKKDEEWDNDKFWLESGIDILNRRIMIDEDVDSTTMSLAVRAIEKMERDSTIKPIEVFINTEGGSCYDGIALYDRLRRCESEIHTIAQGKVMSMGTFLMLAGDKKFSEKNTTFMWHTISSAAPYGKLFELDTEINEVKRLYDVLIRIYAERSSEKKVSWWKRWLRHSDRFGDVEQAKSLGFVDEILD